MITDTELPTPRYICPSANTERYSSSGMQRQWQRSGQVQRAWVERPLWRRPRDRTREQRTAIAAYRAEHSR